MNHHYAEVAVVGGGASGMIAALTAAEDPGRHVLLLEGLGLQPLHVTPCFILQAAIIAYPRGMSVEATLLPASSSSIQGEG